QLRAQNLVYRAQTELGRRVRKVTAVNGAIGDGSNGNDVTTLSTFHVGEERPDEQKRRHEIGVEDRHELVDRGFLGDSDTEDAGVVDENVGRAFQLGYDLRSRALDTCRIGDVGGDRYRASDLVSAFPEARLRAGDHHYPRSLLAEGLCNGGADAARRAGDDSGAAAEGAHSLVSAVVRQAQKFVASLRVFPEGSTKGRGDRLRVLLLDPSHHHAEMISLDHHSDPTRVQDPAKALGYLLR